MILCGTLRKPGHHTHSKNRVIDDLLHYQEVINSHSSIPIELPNNVLTRVLSAYQKFVEETRQAARQRWTKSHSIRAIIISHVLDVCGLKQLQDVSADLQPNRIKIYGKQLSDFNEMFENNINPFDESLDKDILYNIATAKPVPENVAKVLLNIENNGEDLFKYVIPKITNLFFAVNQPNYARCIPIDFTLETTINAEAARCLSGIAHFTNSLAARQRWTKSHSIRAIIISHVLDVCGLKQLQDVSADLQPNRIKIYGKQLSDFNEMFENNINPFDESLDKDILYNIATAKPVPENVAKFLLNIEKNGEDLRKLFITKYAEEWNRFDKPIKKTNA
ncbi:uncharacterized protein TNCV_4651831 [Trichonephila clavipes]|nr:uncharacterized protein TNCV_4651831 [Trichonephila clavipes]